MSLWVRGFVVTDVAQVHELYGECVATATRLVTLERELKLSVGGATALRDLRAGWDTFNLNLKYVADKAALNATKGMRDRLAGTRLRPEAGSTPPLKDLVEAIPLEPVGRFQTGAVGVANVEMLNRAINSHSPGYGPYWRAVEHGTGQSGVPSQIGRVLYGSFMGAGGADQTRPLAEFAGGGSHPLFVSRKAQGGGPTSVDGVTVVGFGTIGKEDPAKHFIRFGADAAAVQWRSDLLAVQDRALSELRGIALAAS